MTISINGVSYEAEILPDGSPAILQWTSSSMFRNASGTVIHQGMTLQELLRACEQDGVVLILAKKK